MPRDRIASEGRRYSRIGYCEICGRVTYCKSDPYNKPPNTCDSKECRHAIYSRARLAQTWRKPAEMITFTCKYCGETVTKKKASINKPGSGQFCNRGCKSAWQRNNPEKLWQWRGGKVTVNCIQCGKEFETWPYVVRDGHGKFCSIECQSAWKSVNTRGEQSPSWKGGKVAIHCEICGKEFKVWPYRLNVTSHLTCSATCRGKLMFQMYFGETHHRYKGIFKRKGYHESFNDEFKDKIRLLFGNKCFMCGIHQDSNAHGSKHDVHHVNPLEFSLPVEDVNDGFMCLCKKCHGDLQKESKFKYWTEYFMTLYDEIFGGWNALYEEHFK